MPIRVALLSVLLICLRSNEARSAEPPARPAELKELERLAGTWKVAEFVAKKAEWTAEEIRSSGDVATTKWIMDGWFLEDRKAPANGSEHLGIWHYDEAEKVYHYTMFQAPGGVRLDLTVRWDEKNQVFNGQGAMPNGVTMRTTTRFADKNTKVWTAVATDATGKVYLDISAKGVRMDAK
jgi:hypothetical protein